VEPVEAASEPVAVSPTSTIHGDLAIRGTELVDLQDFAWITEVSGSLIIEGNPQLKSVEGLQALKGVQGDVIIRKNPGLRRAELKRLVAHLEGAGARSVVVE
jgi:hypothetical protein